MRFRSLDILICTALFAGLIASAMAQENVEEDLKGESDSHMREELGVNEITAPSIQKVLKDLESFKPIPLAIITSNDREVSFNNRLQTALHFGSLVADGFMLTLAERPQDLQEIGRALIRQSRALGVGDRLTKRSKSLLEFSEKGNWQGMREELIKTQMDVETSMMEMRDEEMAHMISLGGWLRGFQLSANSCAQNYTPERAEILGRAEIMDYFLDRLDTLHPRLKKTELVVAITNQLRAIRSVALTAEGRALTQAEVNQLRDLSNAIEQSAMSRVDEEGRFLPANLPL